VEGLEHRVVPTVIFDPAYAKETSVGSAPFSVLHSPKVYLIFWGSGWGSGQTPGPTAVTNLTNGAKALLTSTFFNAENEYGNVGTPTYGGTWTDVSNPPAGYSAASYNSAIDTEVANAITNNPSWAPSGPSLAQSPIYVVIPVPNSGGYNIDRPYNSGEVNIVSVPGAGGSVSTFTLLLSHELAEDISDPSEDATGATFAFPTNPSWPGYINETTNPPGINNNPSLAGNIGYFANSGVIQNGDGEQELGAQAHYSYVLNGVVVQSLWSATTPDKNGSPGAFIVNDGNSGTVYLDPIWQNGLIPNPSTGAPTSPAIFGPVFSNQYDLTIRGNQISLSATDNQLTVVLENTQTYVFANSGVGRIRNITVEPSGPNATVDVTQVAADRSVSIDGNGPLNVEIGTGFLTSSIQGVQGHMTVNNTSASTRITVDDSGDSSAQSFVIGTDARNTALGFVHEAGLPNFDLEFNYGATSGLTLSTGTANGNAVAVWQAGVPTSIWGFGPGARVDVGNGDDGVQEIQQVVTVRNPNYTTGIHIGDQADGTTHNNTIVGTFNGPDNTPWGVIQNLAPADIQFKYSDTSSLAIDTSTGPDDVVRVFHTGVPTDITCNGGAATVNVGNGDNGLQSIRGQLTVSGTTGFHDTTLILGNDADRFARTATLGTHTTIFGQHLGFVSDLAPAEIRYQPGTTANVYVNGGTGGTTFNVLSTPGPRFVPLIGQIYTTTTINCAGEDTVNVGDGNGVQDVLASLTVNSDLIDNVALNLHDESDPTPQTATMDTGSVFGLAPAEIDYGSTALGTLNVYTGTGANTVYIDSTPAAVFIPQVGIVYTQTNIIGGGLDAVVVGGTGRNTQNINGPVDVTNPTSATILFVDDSNDPTGQTVTLTNGDVSGLSPADVTWTASPPGTVTGIARLILDGGSGDNRFDVNDTDTFYQYAAIAPGTGTSTNTVNVRKTTAPLYVYGNGGMDVVTVGSASPAFGGTLDNINGAVNIIGYGGVTSLVVDDQGTSTNEGYDLTSTEVKRSLLDANGNLVPNAAPIDYQGLDHLAMYAGNGAFNLLFLESTAAGTNTDVYGGGNNNQASYTTDAFNVGTPLDGIQGPLALHGRSNTSYANFNDANTAFPGQTYTLTAGALNRTGRAPITYDGMVQDVLYTSERFGAAVNVQSNGDLSTYIAAGPGDVVTIGSQAPGLGGTLDSIRGYVILSSYRTGALPSVVIDDSGDATGRSMTLSAYPQYYDYQLSGLPNGQILFGLDPATPISILGGLGDDTFSVTSPVSYTGITIDGGQGMNTLVGPDAATAWTITGANGGTAGSVAFSHMQNLTGGSAADTFAFRTGGSLTGKLDGRGGVNALDYSAYVGDVTVDLPLNLASRVGQAISNIANVTGSQGNDILVGDANANVLIGGTGRNVIIGGKGADQLFGGSQDNILISGYTKFDQNLTALQAIMAEWTSADTYSKRVKAIGNGVLGTDGMTYALVAGKGKSQTVFDDGVPDVLTGSTNPDPSVLDWLFVGKNTDQMVIPNNKKDTITPIF
jgi:hypothetical protein